MAKRDPILNPASNGSGSPKNASAGRIKSISGPKANNTTPGNGGMPSPRNPYGK